jgi:hypothetical protein
MNSLKYKGKKQAKQLKNKGNNNVNSLKYQGKKQVNLLKNKGKKQAKQLKYKGKNMECFPVQYFPVSRTVGVSGVF